MPSGPSGSAPRITGLLPMADGWSGAATFSACGRYRYKLSRTRVGTESPHSTLLMIMLNPSAAGAEHDSRTLRRCMDFTKRWGHSRLVVCNMFAFRATRPQDLRHEAKRTGGDPIGPENDRVLLEEVERAQQILCAWGSHGSLLGRDRVVCSRLLASNRVLNCLRVTKKGAPWHPLLVRRDTRPIRFVPPPTEPEPSRAGQTMKRRRMP